MPKPSVDVLVIALSSPVLVGVYENQKLIETIESEEMSSEVLPLIFEKLLKKYTVEGLFYANGPGSFMAIKVAYIFLRSISVLKEIPLFARDAFYFNNNAPIKAIGKLCFVKIADTIETQKFQSIPESSFSLPQMLDKSEFSTETAPLYKIAAVGR